MPRNRMIKPEFWEDEDMAKLSFQTRLFYIALWNFADDEGYIKTNPEWLKAKCFPYDKVDIKKLLESLSKLKKVEISNNIAKIINFRKHQKIDRPRDSDLSTMHRRKLDELSPTKYEYNMNMKGKEYEEKDTTASDKLKPVTPQADFILKWESLYNEVSGHKYKADKKDYVLVAGLLKKFSADEVLVKAKILFNACQNGGKLWFAKGIGDFTISKLSSKWNEIIERKDNDQVEMEKFLKKE